MARTRLVCVLLSFLLRIVGAQDAYVPGQLVIRLDPSISDARQHELITSFGVRVRVHYDLLRMFWVDCPNGWDVEEEGARIAADPRVLFALPNYLGWRVGASPIGTPVTPNDPQFGSSYGLDNTGQFVNGTFAPGVGVADADIDAPEAWCIRTDASAAVIAVIDSGCQVNHPDLAGNIWVNPADPVNGIDDDGNGLVDDVNGWDFASGTNNVNDTNGHGTTVTGVCAMIGDNGIGSSGVAWTSRAMILKDGPVFPQAALSALCLQYAAAHDVAVANFSSGFGAAAQPIFAPAIDACRARGVIITVAAGNGVGSPPIGVSIEGGSLDVPAEMSQDNLFVIAASTNTDARASYSSFGPISVDVAAPGTDIWTTGLNSGFRYETGTSYAAPMAAGCVALVRAHYPTLPYRDVINLLMATADVTPAWAGLTVSGGRLNVHAALAGLEYQVNQPSATLLLDGVASDGITSATVTTTAGTPVSIAFSSALSGTAWDLGFGVAPLVSASAGALTSVDNQLLNLDLSDPTAGTWFGVLATSPPFQDITIPGFSFPVPQSLSAQLAVADPSSPSGLALSQGVRLVVQ